MKSLAKHDLPLATTNGVIANDRTHGHIYQRFGDPKDDKVAGAAMKFLEGTAGKPEQDLKTSLSKG